MRLFDEDHDRWELTGVISFGVKRCGSTELPHVFTRFVNYSSCSFFNSNLFTFRILGQVNSWLRQIIGDELPN